MKTKVKVKTKKAQSRATVQNANIAKPEPEVADSPAGIEEEQLAPLPPASQTSIINDDEQKKESVIPIPVIPILSTEGIEFKDVDVIIHEILAHMYAMENKPVDPLKWITSYLREHCPNRSEQIDQEVSDLKEARVYIDSKLRHLQSMVKEKTMEFNDLKTKGRGGMHAFPSLSSFQCISSLEFKDHSQSYVNDPRQAHLIVADPTYASRLKKSSSHVDNENMSIDDQKMTHASSTWKENLRLLGFQNLVDIDLDLDAMSQSANANLLANMSQVENGTIGDTLDTTATAFSTRGDGAFFNPSITTDYAQLSRKPSLT